MEDRQTIILLKKYLFKNLDVNSYIIDLASNCRTKRLVRLL